MTANKDTAKAVNAATALIKYCKRYKLCSNKCIFYTQYVIGDGIYKGCAINRPFSYKEIKEDNE